MKNYINVSKNPIELNHKLIVFFSTPFKDKRLLSVRKQYSIREYSKFLANYVDMEKIDIFVEA